MQKNINDQEQLLQLLIAGDEKTYTKLIDLYYKKLCDYASNLARDESKSEDIVQNVLIRLWIHRENLSVKTSILNYLYKSVYNEFIDQYRKDLAISTLEKKYIEGMELFIEKEDEHKTKKLTLLLEQEIDKLPAKCKETFLLSKKNGFTYTEIAEIQQISVNVVEKQMVKAFSLLKQRLKDKASAFLFFIFREKQKYNF